MKWDYRDSIGKEIQSDNIDRSKVFCYILDWNR